MEGEEIFLKLQEILTAEELERLENYISGLIQKKADDIITEVRKSVKLTMTKL
jgi:hypothetical protein